MSLFREFHKMVEAHAVRHGLPCERHFTDAELAQPSASVAEAERELFGRPLIPFRATITVPGRAPEYLDILADHACDAITRAFEIAFPDGTADELTAGVTVKVEALHRRAA